jgi:cyclopropane fatty-acyl-phospholipid synthase-like methyltransferase
MENNYKQHWETVFLTKEENELSWFQPYPKTSMEFVEQLNLPKESRIIDIGGGDSHFVDALLEKGYRNITVLDISANAIARARKRLGERAEQVKWITTDIVDFEPAEQYDLWHDRAAFHFLKSDEDINKYVSIAEEAIRSKGYLILGTFSTDAPQKCSGLEIRQYSETSMSARFKLSFNRIKCLKEDHSTPSQKLQNFLFCSFRKK